MKLARTTIYTIALIVILLIAARIALPYVVLNYVNNYLQNDLEGYTGSIDDVHISLYRGAYGIDSLKIKKMNGDVPVPFIAIDHIDFSVEWSALLEGAVVGEVKTINPKVNFVDGPTKAQQQTGEEADWRKTLDDLFPLNINRWEVQNGEVHFRNFSTKPVVDLHLSQVNMVGHNFRNSYKTEEQLPASITGSAVVLDDGKLSLQTRLNPLQNPLAFNLALEAKAIDLSKLNEFLQAYGGIDVQKGRFEMYTEVKGSENRFQGYVKPLLTDVKIMDPSDKKDNPGKIVWEGFVGFLNMVFKNWNKDRLATKIPIEGDLSNPEVNVWQTIMGVLKNAFVEAIQPGLEGKVDLSTVGDTEEKDQAPTRVGRAYDKAEKKVEDAIRDIVK